MLLTAHPALRLAAPLLALSAVLTGCGGAGNDDDKPAPPPPPPSSKVKLDFTSPPQLENVLTVNTPVTLELSAFVEGNVAPDNTPVTLSGTYANFAPVQALTRNGMATSTLRGTLAGTLRVQADMAVSAGSASASRTFYVRPTPQALELLVPAYFGTGTGSPWEAMTKGATSFPGTPITAILNPNNGIFTKEDTKLVEAATALRAAGGKVVGYVYTRYGKGTRSLADIKLNIDNYRTFYGSQLDGIFLDEMAATDDRLGFYRDLYTYIKGLDPKLRVIGNPGTFPTAGYAAVADTLVTFEGKASAYRDTDPQPGNTWVYASANTAQAALVHDATTCTSMQEALFSAKLARRNTGVVYVTDLLYNFSTNTGNPWAQLPSYWTRLLGTVDALNKGTALPEC